MGKKEEKFIDIGTYDSQKKKDVRFDLVYYPDNKKGEAILIPEIGASGAKFKVQADNKDDAPQKLVKMLKDAGF
jgi:hypothetical protein